MNDLMPWIASKVNIISPRLRFALQYFHHRGHFPNLSHPKDFSEVIGAQMVNGEIDQYSDLVDKIKVRDVLTDWGFSEYLPKVYRVWERAEDIDLTDCPDKFILKTNHGSGGHVICIDKSSIDLDEVRSHFAHLMSHQYSSLETQYKSITPLVYAEEFIDDGNKIPTDYKFMCLDGRIKAVLLCFDRDANVHKLVYDCDWKKLPYIKGESYIDIEYPCPENFVKMKEIVSSIASRFVQVRVDLYNAFGKIYIGELTFTADGGVLRNFTTKAIKQMGR